MKKILLIITFVMTIFLTTSCQKYLKEEFEISNNEMFRYITNYKKEYQNELEHFPYTILNITKKHINDPVIIFPHTIDGEIATDIGVKIHKGIYGTYWYNLNFGKQEKIYFNSYNNIITGIYFNYRTNLKLFAPNFDYYDLEYTKFKFLNKKRNENNIIYLNYKYYKHAIEINNKYNIQPANVSYYIGDSIPFFIDDIDNDLIKNQPPIPFKYGFEFAGWYHDLDFMNKVDFKNYIIPKKIFDENGNYKYIENKIYAKWIDKETNEIYKYKIYQ